MNSSRGENILVTGASGVLGRILCSKLSQSNTVFTLSGDISQPDSIRDSLPSDINIVIHLAAMVPITTVNENPIRAFEVNVSGTINLLSALQKMDTLPFLFYASTSHVYKSSNRPLSEDSPIEPISLYGKTKRLAEEVITSTYDSDFCIGRIFSFFHETQSGSFLYPTIMKRLATEDLNSPFDLYGADSVRDFLPAEKVCDLISHLSINRYNGTYNIASGQPTVITDFVTQLAKRELTFNKLGKSDTLLANIEKLKTLL